MLLNTAQLCAQLRSRRPLAGQLHSVSSHKSWTYEPFPRQFSLLQVFVRFKAWNELLNINYILDFDTGPFYIPLFNFKDCPDLYNFIGKKH